MDMNAKSGITNGWRTPVNLLLTKWYNIFQGDILWKLPRPLLTGMSKFPASLLLFVVDFNAFSASLGI
jgi:hypothetical protein